MLVIVLFVGSFVVLLLFKLCVLFCLLLFGLFFDLGGLIWLVY